MERKVCLVLDASNGRVEGGRGFPWWFSGKESAQNPPINAGGVGSIPASERFLAEGNSNPPQYSFLENSKHRGAWWATVHGVTKNWTRLSHWAHTRIQNIRKLPPNHVHSTRSEKSAANLIYSLMQNQSDLFLNHMTMSSIVFYFFFFMIIFSTGNWGVCPVEKVSCLSCQ